MNTVYHVDVLGHLYTVPYQLQRAQVDGHITSDTVEIFHDGRRVAVQCAAAPGAASPPTPRTGRRHTRSTWRGHRRASAMGEQTGPRTTEMVRRILDAQPNPEQGYRACLGLLRLGERYTPARLEAACGRALNVGAVSYKSVNRS